MALILKRDKFEEPINAKTMTLEEFKSINGGVVIPSFQRSYSWKNDNVKEFIDDMNDLVLKNEKFLDSGYFNYIGELFLSDLDKRESKYSSLIDGQQRLITVVLSVLSCFWKIELFNKNLNKIISRISDTNKNFDPFEVSKRVNNEAQSIRSFLSNDDKLFISSMNENDDKVLQELSKFDDSESEVMSKIRNDKNNIARMYVLINDICLPSAYNQKMLETPKTIDDEKINDLWVSLEKVINDYETNSNDKFVDDIRSNVFEILQKIGFYKNYAKTIITKTTLTAVKSEDSSSAFVIFETLNNTGLDLKPWDLIKGKAMSASKSKGSNLGAKLTSIADSIEKSDLKESAINNFVGYWINSQIEGFIPQSQYYEKFKELIENDYETTVSSLISNLEFFKKWFENKGSWLNLLFKYLDEQKVYSIVALLNQKSKLHNKEAFNFLSDLAAMVFAAKNILGDSYSEIDLRGMISEVKSTIRNVEFEKVPELLSLMQLPSNKYLFAFYSVIKTSDAQEKIRNYRTDSFEVNNLILYLLLEKDSKDFSPDEYSDLTVEHAIPQNPKQEDIDSIVSTNAKWSTWSSEEKWNSNPYVANIGNLYIIDRSINASLSNSGLEEKADKLLFLKGMHGKDAVLEQEGNEPDYKNISPESIDKRGSALMKKFSDEILKSFIK